MAGVIEAGAHHTGISHPLYSIKPHVSNPHHLTASIKPPYHTTQGGSATRPSFLCILFSVSQSLFTYILSINRFEPVSPKPTLSFIRCANYLKRVGAIIVGSFIHPSVRCWRKYLYYSLIFEFGRSICLVVHDLQSLLLY